MKFTLEQLNKYSNYSQICEKLLSYAKDPTTLNKLKAILYEGETEKFSLKSRFNCRYTPSIERCRRIAHASVLIRNPETFAFFEQNNINIFHGTNANSLPSIIKYGICSHKMLDEHGVPVVTGETFNMGGESREFISFTDDLDTAIDYSTKSSKANNQLSFGMVIGISESQMAASNIVTVLSDKPEIGVLNSFPLEAISCICVPNDKVTFVKKLLINSSITVLGMQDIDEKLYYVDELEDIYIPLLKDYKLTGDKPKYTFNDLKKLALSRSLIKMQEMVDRVKTAFMKRNEDDYGRSIK